MNYLGFFGVERARGHALVFALLVTSGACGGTGGRVAGTDPPELTIADADIVEGDDGTKSMPFVVSLSEALASDLTLDYASNVVTADASDFVIEGGSITIPAGTTEATIRVTVHGDTAFEPDETLTVNLENVPATVHASDLAAFGTIRTDDLPSVSILPAEIAEGDTTSRILSFDVELEGPTNELSVDYGTMDGSATVDDDDYVPVSGTLTIPAGATTATIEVATVGDTQPEPHETLLVTLSDLVGDALLDPGASSAVGTLLDDDTEVALEPTVSAETAIGFEGDVGTTELVFLLEVNTPLASEVVIDYATSDVNAVAGVDYHATSGRIEIAAGATTAMVTVQIIGDAEEEGLEHFILELTMVSTNAALDTPRPWGVIADDDYAGPPLLSIYDASVLEGDDGTSTMTFHVLLSEIAPEVVTVDYAARDVTALAGSDYESASGTLTFAPGETAKSVSVSVFGDDVIEGDEIFEVKLDDLVGDATLFDDVAEGVIETDDPFALVSVADVEALEGDTGTTDLVFTVSISVAAAEVVTLSYVSADGSATAGEDYTAVSGDIVIPPGDTEATITVQVTGDELSEDDETFTIELDDVSQNAQLADLSATGTIVNDDRTPGWGEPRPLAQVGQDDILPSVAMNADGSAMVVWAPSFVGELESRRFAPGSGWGTVEEVSSEIVGTSTGTDRDSFIDGSGKSFFGFISGVAGAAEHTTAAGWADVVEFDPMSYPDQDYIRLAGNESGSVIALWKLNVQGSPGTDHLMYSVYEPVAGEWSASDHVVFEGEFIFSPSIAMNDDGDAVAVWRETEIWASRYDAMTGTFGPPVPVSRELAPGLHAPGYEPQVAIDDAGSAIAVWDGGSSLGTSTVGSVEASRYDAATGLWSEALELDSSSLDATHARVAMDAAGNAFVVWLQDNDGTDGANDSFEMWARRYAVVTDTWEPAELVHDSNTRISQFGFNVGIPLDAQALAVDPDGNAILAWSENVDDDFIIRASRYDAGSPVDGWGPPENISGDAHPFAIFPDIAIDASGNAIVVWQAGDSGVFGSADVCEIWTNDYVR